MKILKKAYQLSLILGLFFLPFNSEVPKWLKVLGEYSSDSSPIFFLASFILLLLYQIFNGKIYFPLGSKLFILLSVFLGVIFLSVIVNLPSISNYYFKQTAGIERFTRQLISIAMSGLIFFYVFYNVCRDLGFKDFFLLTRKIFFISFILVFTCGFFEFFLVNYGIGFLAPIVDLYDYLPFVEIKLDLRLSRISSLTYEPPALGTYLITISGFMFSYIITGKKFHRIIPFILVVLLAFMSKSRTAMVVLALQSLVGLVFAYYLYGNFRKLMNKALIIGVVTGLFFGVIFGKEIYLSISERVASLDFTKMDNKMDDNSISNKTRLGIQTAMFEVFKEKPVLGVGWGQQAYEARFHYPNWATKNNYEFPVIYLNQKLKSFPPGYNLYLRILTETGLIGLLIFSFFLYSIFRDSLQVYRQKGVDNYIVVGLLIGFVGFALNWLQIDSFRIYGFWLCLAILILYKKNVNAKINNSNTALQQ